MMIRLLVLLVSLAMASPSWAAVAFDARSESTIGADGTSLTVSHTTSGSNRALYCACSHTPGDTGVSGVTATYNSVAMDVLFTDEATHGSRTTRVFRLVAPATGANNVVFSWSGTSGMAAVCASYTGVDQADPDDAQVVTDGSAGGTSSSRSVTSAVGDMVMDVLVLSNNASSIAVSGTNTEVNQIDPAGGADDPNAIASSYEAGSATVTPSWGWTGTVSYVQWAWNINADAGGGTPATNFFRLRVNP